MSGTVFEFEKSTAIRMSLVNLEYGHVTVIQPSKIGRAWIYGTIVLPATDDEPERLGREDKWRREKYVLHQGARWDLLKMERAFSAVKHQYEDEERKANYEFEEEGRKLRDKLMEEWRAAHPWPVNPLTGATQQ